MTPTPSDTGLLAERQALHQALMNVVRAGGHTDSLWAEGGLADQVAAFQARAIPTYGRLAATRGWAPGAGGWQDAPLVPTALFRDVDLSHRLLADADTALETADFKTSGTTGAGQRGTRHVPDMTLYNAAMQEPFVEHVLAGATTPQLWWSLIPPAEELPESSLSHMVSALGDVLANKVVRHRPSLASGPAIVLTTAFAIVQHLDAEPPGPPRPLAPGSRMMLTGGFKGRSRELDEEQLLSLIEKRLGIPREAVIPEYGMTELSSQAYGRPFQAPPWLKLRVVAPSTHADMEPGERGLVAFFDLLNLDNVSAIVTSDLGSLNGHGHLTLHGRAPGAVVRGCSLTAEALNIR